MSVMMVTFWVPSTSLASPYGNSIGSDHTRGARAMRNGRPPMSSVAV
jgi:hypothetical protein